MHDGHRERPNAKGCLVLKLHASKPYQEHIHNDAYGPAVSLKVPTNPITHCPNLRQCAMLAAVYAVVRLHMQLAVKHHLAQGMQEAISYLGPSPCMSELRPARHNCG
eukprot:4830928-Amphidinium_carterae.2